MRNGSVAVGCGIGRGSANLVIDVNNGNPSGNGPTRTWRLNQAVVAWAGTITMWGDITVVDLTTGTTTLVGGWTWSVASGAQIDPASDLGFQAAAAEMLNITTSGGSVAAAGLDISTILTWQSNVTKLLINSIRDFFIPYTPPTSCIGPIIEDGAGQSCENAGLLCKNDLADMCLNIADMPGSTGFKKCMKGRCGCGGSNFPRLKIKCDDSSNCGTCKPPAGGCSLAGDEALYCQPDGADACGVCAETVFHEMSHACGSFDDMTCPAPGKCSTLPDPDAFQGACRTGFWFAEQCCLGPPGGN